MIIRSKSGTGKTLVYAIISAEIAMGAFETCATLILVPTRELAVQIATCVKGLTGEIGADVELFIGGKPERKDVARLTGRVPTIVVGTPGRVLSLMEKGALEIGGVKLLVLDEADRLIDGSLGNAVPNICARLGGRKQTLAFSATFSLKLEQLLAKVMRKPKYVYVGEGEDVHRRAVLLGVRQRKVEINEGGGLESKLHLLRRLLQFIPFSFCVVFLNEKRRGAYVAGRICEDGISGAWINADISQSQRLSVMESVRSGEVRVVVTTDLLARGVDIETCDFVVHLDVPQDPKTYLHRVGRAGRFGKLGLSVLVYGGEEEMVAVDRLETLLGFRLRQLGISFEDSVLGNIGDKATTDEQVAQTVLRVRKEVRAEVGMRYDIDTENGNQEIIMGMRNSSSNHKEHVQGQRKKAGEEGNATLAEVCDGRIVDGQFEEIGVEKELGKRVGNNHDNVAEEDMDRTDGIEVDNNRINVETEDKHVIVAGEGTGEAEGFEMNDNGFDPISEMIVRKEGATGTQSNEAWDNFAKRAYNKGYREGYERAYRMAKALGTRLGWGGSEKIVTGLRL